MTIRLIALAALGGCALALINGIVWPLAVYAIVLMFSLPALDRLGYHPTRGSRPFQNEED